MLEKKIDILKKRTEKIVNLYKCPLCGGNFRVENYSLICDKRHTYDFSSKGCVNFFKRPSKITELYDKELFGSRKIVSDSGLYSGLCEKLSEVLRALGSCGVTLDAGSGGGNITSALAEKEETSEFFAVDLSKEAVEFAAVNYFSRNENIHWLVGNLNDIPLKDNSTDVILNVMSPSNYAEFSRILKKSGYLVKVLVGADYLKELRSFIYKENDNNEYSNADVFNHIAENTQIIDSVDVAYSRTLSKEVLPSLFEMTPLTANIKDRERVKHDFTANFDKFSLSLEFKIVICKCL